MCSVCSTIVRLCPSDGKGLSYRSGIVVGNVLPEGVGDDDLGETHQSSRTRICRSLRSTY